MAIINGTALADVLNGTAADDTINGLAGNDTLNGLAGNDTLDGGLGNDTMAGGVGNDTYIVDSTLDVVTEAASAGTDTVRSTVTWTLGTNVENLVLLGTTAINGTGNTLANVITGNSGNNVLNGGTGIDTLIGGLGNDTYVVDAADIVTEAAAAGTDLVQSSVTHTLALNVENLTLTGTAAINGTGNTLANVITGNSGINILNGGTGIDTLIGGLGNDTYVVDAADIVTEAASAGTDLVQSSVTHTLALNVENLTLTGTAAINGTGNTLANIITGNSGNNVLNGGTGIDTLIGGLGDDTYVVDVAGDIVTEAAAAGIDTIQSSVTIAALAANVENLTLTGTAVINGTGNTLNNVIIGNSANNILNGGTAGNDTLNGGLGNDTMVGGIGDDTYVVDSALDIVTEAASAGIDLVQSSVTHTLALNVENLTLTGTAAINGTGNTLNNIITGNSANNILNGGTGIDTLIGGLGNDTYVVDAADIVTEAASAGTDLVQSSVTHTLALNVENLTLTGIAAINGTGNTLNNIITGNSGNNILNGGTGIDTLIGGLGNDTYVVDAADIVTEAAAAGIDLVQSSVTHTLALNVENLTLTGTAAIDGTGNADNNVITGNSNDNLLDGGAGADTLSGMGGDDILVGRAGADTLNGAEGNDNLLGGADNDTLNGGIGNDLLAGEAGNDTLDGGADVDILLGQAGNDTLVWDANDAIVNGGIDTDTLQVNGAGQTLDLTAIPNGKIQGIEIINITGSGNNTLTLDPLDVLALSPTTDTLRVDGNAGDEVHSNVHWTYGTTIEIDGHTYHQITNSGATLQIRDGVEFLAPNDAPTGAAAFLENGTEDTSYLIDTDILLDGVSDPEDDPVFVSDITSDQGTVVDNGNGTWTFTPDDEDYSGTVTLDYVLEDAFGATTATSTTFELDGDADAPTLTTLDATGIEDSEISLNINAALTDGSETLSIVISGVPEGALLSAGTDNNDGSWTLAPGDLVGLTITPPADSEDSFDLTVTAISTDGTSTANTIETIHVTIVPEEDAPVTEGTAVDGYIAGATVFADANGNGEIDDGEAWTTTGGSGQFSLVGGSGQLVLFGGTDISTGLAFEGFLLAPEGSTVITPLTTLIAAIMDDGAVSAATAESQLEAALGLTDVDLTTFDPIAAALDGDAGNDAAALSVFAAGVQVQNAVVLASSLLTGAGATSSDDATASVFIALAETINGSGTIDLSSAGEMETLVSDAAANLSIDVAATAANAGAIIAASNTAVDDAVEAPGDNLEVLTGIVQVAAVVNGDAAAALEVAGDTGDATAAQTAFTGANLDTAVDDAADDVGAVGGAVNGTNGNNTLNGTAGNDVLDGLGGNDFLAGVAGNDQLFGGTGTDNLDGGDGNDGLFGGAGDDVLIGGAGNDLLDGGENPANQLNDSDTVNYSLNDGIGGATGVNVNLATGIASDGLGGGTDTLVNIERAIGTNFNDVLTGGDPTNLGTQRSETLEGRGGDDIITGGAIIGGYQTFAVYIGSGSGVRVNIGDADIDMSEHGGSGMLLAGTAWDGFGGTDTLNEINRVRGSAFNDFLFGGDSPVDSNGNTTNERFEGMAGNDYIDGGAGIDYLNYNNGNSVTGVSVTFDTAGDGVVANDGFGTTDTFLDIEGVRGSQHADVLTGSNRNDGVTERFEGMAGNDIITGNGGTDRLEFSQSPTAVIVNFSNSTIGVGQTIIGANSVFDGFGGVDTISGIEQVSGSRFNDTFISGTPSSRFDGGVGVDTVSYQAGSNGVTVTLALGIGGGGNTSQNTVGAGVDTLVNIENLTGTSFTDTLTGDANANTLSGRGGNDFLTGGAGNDVLNGGENSANSTADSDTVNYDLAGATSVNVNLATGTASDGLGGTDTLINVERVIGTAFNDALTGGDTANIGTGASEQFEGLAGDDVITGGSIADGFTAISTYTSAPSGIKVNLSGVVADLDGDLVAAGTAMDGYGDVDTLVDINRIRGSAFADFILGGNPVTVSGDPDGAGVERFDGMGGNDWIDGGAGYDILQYQNGTSHGVSVTLGADGSGIVLDDGFVVPSQDEFFNIEGVRGTSFNDVLTGSNRVDVVERLEGLGGNDIITGGGGIDRADYTGSGSGVNVNLATGTALDGFGGTDTLSGIEQVAGSRLDDTLIGNSGDNLLNGMAGSDTLIGGAGNDVLNGGENLENQLSDSDIVNYSLNDGIGGATGVNVNLATGTASDGLGGTDTLLNIERVFGTAFNDVITGGDTANINTGKSEQFEGRGGNDVITGGGIALGFGTFAMYSGDPAGIKVNLDTVDHVLGGINVLAGTAQDGYGTMDILVDINRIRGSAHADWMMGGDPVSAVNPGAGTERLEGMAGNDWIDGGAGIDYLGFNAGSPVTGVTVDLGDDGFAVGSGIVANDGFGTVDTFFNIEGVRGTNFADTLKGSDRGDVVERFEGMTGNDTIMGNDGLDRVEYGQSENGINVNLALGTALDGWGTVDTLSGIEQVTGSRLNDTITGNGNSNRLDGSEGDDRIAGGAGHDLLIGGLDADTFDWNSGDQGPSGSPAVDTVTDFNMGAGDRLDLRDLLVGENGSNLDQYLDFSLDGVDTVIDIRSTGLSGDVGQVIVLENVDLTAGSTLSDATIINSLLSSGALLADGVI